MAHKHANRAARMARAFSLTEVLIAIVIIGILAAVVVPRLLGRIGQSKEASAKSSIASLGTAMRGYMMDCGSPESGADLRILWERPASVAETAWKGPYVENPDALIDPWGHPYELVIPPQFNADFDIVSYGADGQPGGEGENQDIVLNKK